MTKKLMIGAAGTALMVSGALAQSPQPAPASKANPPPAAQSAPDAKTTAAQPSGKADAGQPSGKADFVMSQKPDQWLASNFKGTDVLGSDNQKIGDVSDILFDKTGQIEAYVISVGGFLGMGAKEVAMAPKSFEVVAGQNGGADKLKTSMTKDQLTQTQNFARYAPPRPTTTGSGPGGLGAGGMRPSSNTPPTGR